MILVTGGLGFIGSHTCVELLNNNHQIVIVDNLSNSKIKNHKSIFKITQKQSYFYELDLLNFNQLEEIFKKHNITEIIHFAGSKAVSESIKKPIYYYENNIITTMNLLKLSKKYNVKKFIFSSSATVYGSSKSPLSEESLIGVGITNPYGRTKYFIEEILKDFSKANTNINFISLRYFNPVGCHSSQLIYEDPNGIPNNLMPYVIRVAMKNNIDDTLDDVYKELNIFGYDYPTRDGTAIRDYIHVVDLAKAHVKAVESKIDKSYEVYNVGTGKGTTVLEIVETFKKVNKLKLPYKMVNRRDGDLDIVYCYSNKIERELGWKCEKTLEDVCRINLNLLN